MARVLLWHGYLLTGSGSNIYSANLARVWRAQGHDVVVMCQDKDAAALPFVDAVGDFTPDNEGWQAASTGTAGAVGRCTVVRPDIGGLLPVYVFDRYEGFVVKLFEDLTGDELERYTTDNVKALAVAIARHRPHAIVTGHEVMGPFIAREACRPAGVSYVAKLHGSALEYAVKRQERYREYARLGLSAAAYVAGGSRYMIEEASAVVPGWRDRAVVVSPGCDVELFKPVPRAGGSPPKLGFVGKLLVAKGVHHLLVAVGDTTVAGLEVEIVGYGGDERRLRDLGAALAGGRADPALELVEKADGRSFESMARFLAARRDRRGYWARLAGVPVTWRGRLDHGPLAAVLPTWDALAVPSVVPEAFGMVAAEAAAAGVLPIVPAHSGIGEVGETLEGDLGAPGLLSYDPSDPVPGLARAIDRVLGMPAGDRRALGAAAARVARERWTWERTAERLLELATDPEAEPRRRAVVESPDG